jgi:hypothetical protein
MTECRFYLVKNIARKVRYVVFYCSVNMFHRYPVLENKTVQKKQCCATPSVVTAVPLPM